MPEDPRPLSDERYALAGTVSQPPRAVPGGVVAQLADAIASIEQKPAQALEDILKDMADEGDVEVGKELLEDASLDDMVDVITSYSIHYTKLYD